MNGPGMQIRRILVALDSSASTADSLDAAAKLARRLRAELQGLFVEDDALLQLATLPFMTQINLTTGGRQPLEMLELESQMKALAVTAQRRLAAVAERDRLAWSFRTVRGRIAHEVAIAAEGADLVIVEGGRHGGPGHARLGLPASATVKRVTRSVLILRDGRHIEGRIFVVFDGSAQSEKALQMASTLMQDSGALSILLPDKTDKSVKELSKHARRLLGDKAEPVRIETFSADTLDGLCARVGRTDTGLVVMGADNPLLSAGDVGGLLDTIACTLLLVR